MGGIGSNPLGPREGTLQKVPEMETLYRSGHTLQEIAAAQTPPISRQAVEQLLRRYTSVKAIDGGAGIRAKRARQAKQQVVNARHIKEKGCTTAQYRGIQQFGREMRANGFPYARTPITAFTVQRNNAKARGIEWCMNLWEWWQIWQASGKWEQRGRGQGYVMSRLGDTGPYSADNVFIIPAIQNTSDTKQKKSGLPCGVVTVRGGKYEARRMINGTRRYLGTFSTSESARAAYLTCGVSA